MLTIPGISRRSFLRIGTLGLGGLTLADLMRLQGQGAARAQAKSVILIYMAGGPSHIDTYDMKPAAPVDFRGEFNPIKTNVPGMDICELMPRQAAMADKFSLIRGLQVSAGVADHKPSLIFSGFPESGRPVVGAVVSRLQGDGQEAMPPYISLRGHGHPSYLDPEDPAYLGTAHRPFVPSGPDIQNLSLPQDVSMGRLGERRQLLRSFDNVRRDLDTKGELAGMDAMAARAFRMIASPRVRDALDVGREPDRLRARYGDAGLPFLLARRLVAAGARIVTLSAPFTNLADMKKVNFDWDTHQKNFTSLRWKLPRYDQALSALLTDLEERGLNREVVVLVCGEMGRAPRVGKSSGSKMFWPDGRDHWPVGFALLSGGGLRMGQVVGATDSHAEACKGRPYAPQNLLATLYHVLGIDPALTFPDHAGRPQFLLDDREKIEELL
jgi:hypothetical protein